MGSLEVSVCAHVVESFNISRTASLYSTVAGVMAGFAFASVSYLMQRGPGSTRGSADPARAARYDLAAQALGAAFLALLLACINWAVLAGETVTSGRASTIEIYAGCGFVVSAVHLFYSILLMVEWHESRRSALRGFFQTAGGAFLCPLAFVLAALGVTDYEQTTPGTPGVVVLVVALALAGVVVAAAVGIRAKSKKSGSPIGAGQSVSRWRNPSLVVVATSATMLLAGSAFGAALNQCSAVSPVVADRKSVV